MSTVFAGAFALLLIMHYGHRCILAGQHETTMQFIRRGEKEKPRVTRELMKV